MLQLRRRGPWSRESDVQYRPEVRSHHHETCLACIATSLQAGSDSVRGPDMMRPRPARDVLFRLVQYMLTINYVYGTISQQ